MPSSAERRQWRRKLRKDYNKLLAGVLAGRVAEYKQCDFPTCDLPAITDCCYEHSINDRVQGDAFLDNDGIIDWQAIDVARRGLRVVRLTWVEYEIAGAYILADGETQEEMRERTGITCRRGGERIARMKALATHFNPAWDEELADASA